MVNRPWADGYGCPCLQEEMAGDGAAIAGISNNSNIITMLSTVPSSLSGFHIRPLSPNDAPALYQYLNNLSDLSKKRFGPHPFDQATIEAICYQLVHDNCIRLTCFKGDECIAYALLQPGILPADEERYRGYGFEVSKYRFATYAPSVSENYHGVGIAQRMFDHLENEAGKWGVDYMVLWGGVQHGNPRARRFYERNGFVSIGSFDLNGGDDDMLKAILPGRGAVADGGL